MPEPKPTYFASPAAWRAWLEQHHASKAELVVGFYKRGSGRPSITWPESVDQALCFGWIDGVRRSIDERRYTIRFTPRQARSTWSTVNVKRMGQLAELGLVHAAGVAAFAARDAKRSGIYAYEARQHATFDAKAARRFKSDAAAWTFFSEQAPWYRRTAAFWVASAKRETTRASRLETLIAHSAAGRRLPALDRARAAVRRPRGA
ncbi:MAG TPA: YdeI/OmpD-associated family protein [Gemmatimonadaceae bacterium]|nr:YdeI/OmpD-associated family protein [Gemmatimonadaceae bacterium]